MANLLQRIFLGSAKNTEHRNLNGAMPLSYGSYRSILDTWFGAFGNKAKVQVTPESAQTVSPFYSAVRNISEDIAKMPFKVMVTRSDNNRYPNYQHPAFKLFGMRPNDFNTPFTFIETMLKYALIRGNSYAYIERNSNAEPIAMYWLNNDFVNPVLSNKKIFYIVNDTELSINGTFDSQSIFHLRGLGDGYVGKSVLTYAGESLGKAIATQQFGSSFFGSAGIKGIVKFKGLKDETKVIAQKEAFKRTYEADGIAATNADFEYEKLNIPNNEAQFIESQDFNVSDIARWFRMPLSKLQKDENTGSEQEMINYVNDCLYPWIKRIEQEIEAKLFREDEKFNTDAKFVTDELLRGDTQAQERRIKTMFMTGAWSVNQILRFMDYNTIGVEGQRRYVPVNMIPSDMVEEFWADKLAKNNQSTQSSADSSGSGAVNDNVGQFNM